MNSSLYIDLLKKSLIDHLKINAYEYHPLEIVDPNWKTRVLFFLDKLLKMRNFRICKVKYVDENARLNGSDWPANALTMIGMKRLNNIEFCMHQIIENDVPGDFIETGVWRGGATILMRAILRELEIADRKVWLADSFKGLPAANVAQFPADRESKLHGIKLLNVSREDVERNFRCFGLLDDQVVFLEGWFRDTLPMVKDVQFSLLRLDGDLYESTYLALEYLYPKLSVGGYVIVDDYYAFPYCKAAVDTYRKENGLTDALQLIDQEAVFWRKT